MMTMSRMRSSRVVALLAVVVLLLGMAPSADAAGKNDPLKGADLSKFEPALVTSIEAGNRRDRYPVIVQRVPSKDKAAKRLHSLAVEKDLKAEGGTNHRHLSLINGQSVTLPSKAIVKLSRNKHVKALSKDHDLQLAQITTVPTLLSTATIASRAPEVWAQAPTGYTGAGVTVAVIDSGVAVNADITNLSFGVDVATGTTALSDLGGHGTHVAGIIAGNGSMQDGAYKGVAPDARILSVKVTTNDGHASYSSIISGIQWAVSNKKLQNIRVMNLSLGAQAVAGFVADPLDAAVEIAWFRGIAVVASAGNSGPEPGTTVVPGNDPYIITVGAYDDNQTGGTTSDDVMPDWSSRGPTPFDGLNKPDLVASGRRVVSLRTPGSFLDGLFQDRIEGTELEYFRLSGTSMSSPVVAGVVALMIQAKPNLTPNQIKYILKHTARPMVGGVNDVGSGAVAAVALAKQGVGLNKANKNQVPNRKTASAVWPVIKTLSPVWRNTGVWRGRMWVDGGWDALAWSDGGWDSAGWDSADWDTASKPNVPD